MTQPMTAERPEPMTPEERALLTSEGFGWVLTYIDALLTHIDHLTWHGPGPDPRDIYLSLKLENDDLRAEVSRLTAERDDAREQEAAAKMMVHGYNLSIQEQKRLATLAAENERLREERDKAERQIEPARKILEEYEVLRLDWSLEPGGDFDRVMKSCRLMIEADNKRIAAESQLAAQAATIEQLTKDLENHKKLGLKEAATIERQRE